MEQTVEQRVISAIKAVVLKADADDKTEILSTSNFSTFGDSLMKTEMLMAIEEAFDLEYTPQEEVEKMRLVQDAIDYVNRATASA